MNISVDNCSERYDPRGELSRFILFQAYCIPTQIISFILFYIIFCSKNRKQFSSPFYTFFGVNTIPSFFFFLTDQLLSRGMVLLQGSCQFWLTIIPGFSHIISIIFALSFHVEYSQLLICIIISFNRLTAIACPAYHIKFWNKYRSIFVLLILFLPFFCTFQVYGAPHGYVQPPRNGVTMNYEKYIPWFRTSYATLGYYSLALICMSINTIITVILLYSLPNRIKSAEIQLCVIGVILAVGTSFAAGIQIMMFLYANRVGSLVWLLRYVASDIPFVSSTWSLVIMSSDIRREFLHILGFKAKQEVVQVSQTVVTDIH